MEKHGLPISVVMTIYTGKEFLKEAVESILHQTYKNFEFIIIVEKGTNQNIIDLLKDYEKRDDRIFLFFNKDKLGLAESLNHGIQLASGRYIARMDDDDVSLPERFEKQLEFLEKNPDIGVCGCLQLTVTPERESILFCASEPEELKAELLFGCQLSHTSVMFRRKLFIDHQWFYNKEKIAEDFDLWLRILDKIKFANINEVLVKHRYGFHNLSQKKGMTLIKANRDYIKAALVQYLQIDITGWSDEVFCAWRNFPVFSKEKEMVDFLFENLKFLEMLDKKNKEISFVNTEIFSGVLMKRFRWLLNNIAKKIGIQETARIFDYIETNAKLSFNENIKIILDNICPTKSKNCEEAWKQYLFLPFGRRIIIWGAGKAWHRFCNRYSIEEFHKNYKIIGMCDNLKKFESFGVEQIVLGDLIKKEYDYVLITTGQYFFDIKRQLQFKYHVPKEKIGLLDQIYLQLESLKSKSL